MRLKGMVAVFNDAVRMRLCDSSSGSEHYSPEDSDDLSDLVNSFIETDFTNHDPEVNNQDPETESNIKESASYCSDSESNNKLQNLLSNEDEDDELRRIIQLAGEIIREKASEGFNKRTLMSHLRHHGFDAGLCKSRWEKFGKNPSGEYEYIDVNIDGNRFIIDVNLATEFEIARPTTAYTTLLNYFPKVFIGKPEKLKQIVRLMCNAVRLSMKKMKLYVPPWRRKGYMEVKWFGPYKRTINDIAVKNKVFFDVGKRSIGFEAFSVKGYNCRDNYCVAKVGLKVGYLTAALNGDEMDLKL
ncbi:uncharacterized protein [Euphorbia lathyris]|uniref:uncharacterized protein n=1 Tax=Euphorbia lathyris TaxID=212925 RepID=UPI003313ECF4